MIATIVAAMVMGMTGCGTDAEKAVNLSMDGKMEEQAEKAVEKEIKKSVKTKVQISVKADKGWDKDSTPAIAHIVSKDKKTDFYHAVKPDSKGGTGTTEIKLAEGDYTLKFVSPLNKDGSAYEVYDMGKAQEVTVTKGAIDGVKVDVQMTQIPADKVTDEMVQDIVNKTQDAIENGDETLKGDAGKDVLEKLEENVSNNPNVSDKTKEETEAVKENTDTENKAEENQAAETKKDETKAEENKTQGSQQTTTDAKPQETQKPVEQKPATEQKPSEQKPIEVHQHAWQDHVTTVPVWVPNIVTVDDYDYQNVLVGSVWVCNCGARITSGEKEHAMNHILNGEDDGGHDEPAYESQLVKVGSHTEDHGYYENQTKVDYQYCACGATR